MPLDAQALKHLGLLTAGAAGLGTAAALTGPKDVNTGKRVPRWRIYKTKLAVKKALVRLQLGDFDIPEGTGLDRIILPAKDIDEPALQFAGFRPSVIAVPERGQSQLTTYRQTGTHAHLHKHPEMWTLHKDRWPALSMALTPEQLKNVPVQEALLEGVKHPALEGVTGWISYIKDKLQGNLTYDEIAKVKMEPEKHPELVRQYNRQLGRQALQVLDKYSKQAAVSEDNKAEAVLRLVTKLEKQLANKAKKEKVPLRIKNKHKAVKVEIADTDAAKTAGLSGRYFMEKDSGMLFTSAGNYWMKDTYIPLDLVFLSKEGTVLEIKTMPVERNPAYPLRLYGPSVKNATMALEVAAGWCKDNSLVLGDVLEVAGAL